MFQVVFNEISASEMSAMSRAAQLSLLADFDVLPEELDAAEGNKFGVIERDGKRLYRHRVSDYRIYFERVPEGISVHRVLHRNTIRDFLFRASLPMPAEDKELSQQGRFWELIDEGRSARKH